LSEHSKQSMPRRLRIGKGVISPDGRKHMTLHVDVYNRLVEKGTFKDQSFGGLITRILDELEALQQAENVRIIQQQQHKKK
jgi:hypothetical protein